MNDTMQPEGARKEATRHAKWQVRLFGGLQVYRDNEPPLKFDTRHAAALFAYLAFYPNRVHSREILSEQLWPDENGDATRSRLRTALWSTRRILEDGDEAGAMLVSERGGVRLEGSAVCTDVASFDQALKRARTATDLSEKAVSYREAAELYSGELLPGCYEEWISSERERLAEAYRACLRKLAAVLAGTGDISVALEFACKAVALDPLHEAAHLELIKLYLEAGRNSDAIRQHKRLTTIMQSEFGVPPSVTLAEIMAPVQNFGHTSRPGLRSFGPERHTAEEQGQIRLESEGGAVPLESSFYIERDTDALFVNAVLRRDSIVLVKGARQSGKTSLLSRGLQKARDAGLRVVQSDLQRLTSSQLQSSELLFQELAREIADQLDLSTDVAKLWNPAWGWNVNFERFLRRDVLGADAAPLVWGMDEVDRLFSFPYSSDVFGLFRSWHNARSLAPTGPWSRLTLAMAYATEVHLFITDLNQSPFNVGTRLTLRDFGKAELSRLNQRYGSPVKTENEINRYFALVGGNPYLIRIGLHCMAESGVSLDALEESAGHDDSVFADALRRMRATLIRSPELIAAVREVLAGKLCSTNEAFFGLHSAGLIVGASRAEARMRCKLYEQYLSQHPV